MKPFTFFIIFFVTATVNAQKASVLIMDQDIDSTPIQNSYKIETPSAQVLLPDKALRDQVMAGISSVEGWDELKKDIFYMDLSSKSKEKIQKKYPGISLVDLNLMLKRK